MEANDLIRRAEDLWERCRRSYLVTSTGFLTPAEQYELRRVFAHREGAPVFLGGAEDCERQCAFFLPDYMEEADLDAEEYLRCVKLHSYFGAPGHRDYLGAAVALGIRREWLGDIRVREDTAWIFCLPSVEPVLLDMDRVGRYTVKSERCSLSAVPPEEGKRESLTFTVQSLRLDAVTGGLFRLSRSAAAEQIRLGLVSLNYSPCLRPDALIREGDVISLRGKGKGSVTQIGGRSRKDRLFVTAERRV